MNCDVQMSLNSYVQMSMNESLPITSLVQLATFSWIRRSKVINQTFSLSISEGIFTSIENWFLAINNSWIVLKAIRHQLRHKLQIKAILHHVFESFKINNGTNQFVFDTHHKGQRYHKAVAELGEEAIAFLHVAYAIEPGGISVVSALWCSLTRRVTFPRFCMLVPDTI